MINHFWRLLAKLLARPAIADWIIARAMRTPYDHLIVCDGRIRGTAAGTQQIRS